MAKIFVGIDIGKNINVIRFFNEKREEIRKKTSLKNNYYGYYKFKEILDILMYDNNLKSYDEIKIGIESTGHYWINLKRTLNKFGINNIVMVQGSAVKAMRNLIARQKGKNDPIDSKSIAYCVKDGYYSCINSRPTYINALKSMSRLRNELNEDLTSIKNKIHFWLDLNNQFFLTVFNVLNVTAIAILDKYPMPKDVLEIKEKDFKDEIMKENSHIDRKKISLYIEEVETWKEYIIDNDISARNEIKCYIQIYKDFTNSIKNLDKEIEELSKNIYGELYISLCNVKGMSNFNVSSLLAEIGDFKLFKTARTLQGFAGLSIKSKSSGLHEGSKKLTKSGNRRIRKYLYVIARQLIMHNSDIKKLYCYYLAYEREKENRRIEMWVATMCKILRCIYGSMKNNSKFNTNEIFKTLDFSKCNMEKFNKLYSNFNIEKVINEGEKSKKVSEKVPKKVSEENMLKS